MDRAPNPLATPPQEEVGIDDLDRQLAALRVEEKKRADDPFAVCLPYQPSVHHHQGAFGRCQSRRCKALPVWLMKAKNGKVSAACSEHKALEWEAFQYCCRLSDGAITKKPDREMLQDSHMFEPPHSGWGATLEDTVLLELAEEIIAVARPAPIVPQVTVPPLPQQHQRME
jgi:hypothetical protein